MGAERGHWEHHLSKNHWRRASSKLFFIIDIFIYNNPFIFKRNMQNAKLVAKYMKICIFLLLVDKHYSIMKLEMSSIVHLH